MILSKYNVYYAHDQMQTIYNTLKRRLITIPKSMFDNLDYNNIPKILEDFFVINEIQERNETIYRLNSMIYQSTRINLTIMMTMKCNFQCVYCFEGWIPDSLREVELDEKAVVEWVIDLIKKYNFSQVDICFHGGEPLIEIKKIEYIAKKLLAFFEANGIFHLFTMVSNGYLFSEEAIRTLEESSIKIIQITVDGTASIHDKRRMLKNGEGTFEKIINNIKKNDKIDCYLSINYDKDNYKSVYELIDYLNSENFHDRIKMVMINSVKPIINDTDIANSYVSFREDGDIRVDLFKYIIQKGFKVPFELELQLCTTKQKCSFVIVPGGKIYKCISGVGMDPFFVCDMNTDIDPFGQQTEFLTKTYEGCDDCTYMPICNKFCYYESHIKIMVKKYAEKLTGIII